MRHMTVEERDLDPKQAFGKRIRQLRGEKRLSAVKAGEAAGISREWWAMFEAGRRRDGSPFKPEAVTVLNVAKVVGIPGDEALRVYGHDPAFFPQATSGRPLASAQELAAKVGKLTEDERAALVPIVDLLLQQRGHLPSSTDKLPTTKPLGEIIVGDEVEIGPEPIREDDRHRPASEPS